LIEKQDAVLLKEGDTVTFINWGNMKIPEDGIKRDDSGEVVSIEVDLDLENKVFILLMKIFQIGELCSHRKSIKLKSPD
jgi:hypothetical protein